MASTINKQNTVHNDTFRKKVVISLLQFAFAFDQTNWCDERHDSESITEKLMHYQGSADYARNAD